MSAFLCSIPHSYEFKARYMFQNTCTYLSRFIFGLNAPDNMRYSACI